ncbi:major tail protein [Bacillus sp. 1P06AnD]|uniref:major tail protein n=1 Tax=Bacillus sp. 1P06AnD TaxID=3132208 RepID=UPI0039A2306E
MANLAKENKVTFGLKNAHYATFTEDADGSITYDKPVPLLGSKEMSMDPKGELSEFYADDTVYYVADSNQGYEGSYTLAELPEQFRIDVLGEKLENGVITENANAKIKPIALLFEFDGDVKATRHVLYNVKVSRPGLSSASKEESVDPNTIELSFTASPRADGVVKRKTSVSMDDAAYNAWYSSVFEPAPTV